MTNWRAVILRGDEGLGAGVQGQVGSTSDCLSHTGLAYPAGKRAGDRELAEAALTAWARFENQREERGDRAAFFGALACWSDARDRILAKLIGGTR